MMEQDILQQICDAIGMENNDDVNLIAIAHGGKDAGGSIFIHGAPKDLIVSLTASMSTDPRLRAIIETAVDFLKYTERDEPKVTGLLSNIIGEA
jgi:hypothetical protein